MHDHPSSKSIPQDDSTMQVAHAEQPGRLLITGGAGFIGSNLVMQAVQQGHQVLNLDKLTYASSYQMLRQLDADPRYRFMNADIADGSVVTQALQQFSPTAVIHLAAETHVDRSIDDARPFVEANIVGTFQLLSQLLKYWRGELSVRPPSTFRLVHISTDEVYGSLGTEGCFTESSSYQPRSPYSASKAAADHLVRAWFHTYQLPSLVIHPSNNYGPNQHREKLIPMVIRQCLQQAPIPVYGDGKNVRDWLYVKDACRAILILTQKGQPGESYNLGGENCWSNLSLVETICDLFDQLMEGQLEKQPGRHGPSRRLVTFVADRPGHDFRYALDCSKIKQFTGWQPNYTGTRGFQETIGWYLANRYRLE